MPFTPAHPAAILPLPRLSGKWSVPSALVIGSMVPDFVFFLPLGLHRLDSHSLAGIFWFCLPAGLAAYLTFHVFLKAPMRGLLPAFISRRLDHVIAKEHLPHVSWQAVGISLLFGILTHLAWDAFTHEGAAGVQVIPLLRVSVYSLGDYHVYAYRLLQYLSSALGLMVLSVWGFQWLMKIAPGPEPDPALPPRQRLLALTSLIGIPGVCGLISGVLSISFPLTARNLELTAGQGVIVLFDAFGFVLLVYSLWWHISPQRTK